MQHKRKLVAWGGKNNKNLTLASSWFKRIEANYLYVYQTNFMLKFSHMIFLTFHSDLKPHDTKTASDNPKKIKW
jgi:hypothetical protein